MLTAKPSFEKHIQALLDRLRETETSEFDFIVRIETCLKACDESLQQLRQWVIDHSFPDKETEIYFFKSVKPLVAGRYMYYHKLFRLHSLHFKGSVILENGRLNGTLQEIARFFSDNQRFYDYYRMGGAYYDELYFLRGQYDWKICPETCNLDTVFSTSCDAKMAELIAYELLLGHVEGLLNPPGLTESHATPARSSSTIFCTAAPTSIVELGYALYASGFFNHGKASIKDIMQFLSDVLKVDLQKYYHTFLQIRERKNGPTKYLDELKASLVKYIDKMEE